MALDEKDKRPEETGTDTAEMGSATLGGYVNPYEGQIMELYKGISERKPFRYDVNEDVMYQNLRDQYIAGGQMAMMDTMGQAAQLTGGYGNSYAQGVGQQAYQGYLRGLNDQIPDLYNMALQNYIQTGDAMLQEYGMLQDMAADDYGKYQDQMALVQPQVLEMLESGIRPSDEMIAASGLSKEYIDALYPGLLDGTGDDGGWRASDWFHSDGTVKLNKVQSGYRNTAAQYNVDLKGSDGGRGNKTWNEQHTEKVGGNTGGGSGYDGMTIKQKFDAILESATSREDALYALSFLKPEVGDTAYGDMERTIDRIFGGN